MKRDSAEDKSLLKSVSRRACWKINIKHWLHTNRQESYHHWLLSWRDYRIIKSNKVLLRPFCQVSELLIIPTWIRDNHSTCDANKHARQPFQRRLGISEEGRIPPFTPPPPYLFCRAIMEAVAQDGGSFEAKCDGTFLGFDWTFYCANQSLWAERKSLIKIYPSRNKTRRRIWVGRGRGENGRLGDWHLSWWRNEPRLKMRVMGCWCGSWGGSPRCLTRLSGIYIKNKGITISWGGFKMLHASSPVGLCAPADSCGSNLILTNSRQPDKNNMFHWFDLIFFLIFYTLYHWVSLVSICWATTVNHG